MLRYSSYINTKYGNTINPSSSMFFFFLMFCGNEGERKSSLVSSSRRSKSTCPNQKLFRIPPQETQHTHTATIKFKGMMKKVFLNVPTNKYLYDERIIYTKNMFATYNTERNKVTLISVFR